MIISKTPYRVSLFGGSTDYREFFREHTSMLLGFCVNKYCYVLLRDNPLIFPYKSKISYSVTETVQNNEDIKHDGVRGVLKYLNEINSRLEINIPCDLPSQTGMGSSSSFVVGLIKAIMHRRNESLSKHVLAQLAINIERDYLCEPGGIQDQIWAAYGGFNSITIDKQGWYKVAPLPISEYFINGFFERAFLIYTGRTRKSFEIASSHADKNQYKLEILDIAKEAYREFENENVCAIGRLLEKTWEKKKGISNLISNSDIDNLYKDLKSNGMMGGKLLGSGGSGFVFGIADSPASKKRIIDKYRNQYIDIGLSNNGSEIINA